VPDPRVNVVLGAKDEATKVVTGLRGQFEKFRKDAVTGFGLGAGINVFNMASRAIGGVVDFMGDAVEIASDLAEQQGKVDTVFGDSADTVREWGETAAESMGLSERAALTAAGTFGAMFDAMGLSDEAAADLSMSVTQLAADLGAFYNVANDDALIALRSGLVGEAEPMRRFGVLLNAAAVEQKVLALGLAKTKGAITEQMKVMGRWAIIQDQTAVAQGNFAATGDNLAQVQKTIAAEMENVQAEIGSALLPAMRDLALFARDTVIPTFVFLLDTLGAAGEAFNNLNRLVNPGIGNLQDYWKEVDALAEKYGVANAAANEQAETILTMARAWATGTTAAEVMAVLLGEVETAFRDMGHEQNAAALGAIRTAYYFGRLVPVVDDVGDAFQHAVIDVRTLPNAIRDARNAALHEAIQIGPSLRDTIKASREAVREAVTDLRWAMEHPFTGRKYVTFLQDKQEEANRLLVRAIRQGKNDAAAEASDLVWAIQQELAKLRGIDFAMNVNADFSIHAPGAPPRRAHGGPVSAGQTFLVGENGPEFLHMGSQSGHVTPDGGGSMRPIVVNVDGHELFRIMDARGGSRYATAGRGSYYRTAE